MPQQEKWAGSPEQWREDLKDQIKDTKILVENFKKNLELLEPLVDGAEIGEVKKIYSYLTQLNHDLHETTEFLDRNEEPIDNRWG